MSAALCYILYSTDGVSGNRCDRRKGHEGPCSGNVVPPASFWSFAAIFDRAKGEIQDDTLDGTLPYKTPEQASFEALHEYVDANAYGGFCDFDCPVDPGHPEGEALVNRVQNALDAWLKTLRCGNCAQQALGDCPSCYEATGAGCPHGIACDDCMAEALEDERRTKAKMGVWTPWAEVLCIPCHDTRTAQGTFKILSEPDMRAIYADDPDTFWPGVCTGCDKEIMLPNEDVAVLSRIRKILRSGEDFGPAMEMEQTGGMCAALTYERADGKRVMVTYAMCEPESLEIGVYRVDEEDEMDQISYITLQGGDDAALADAVRGVCA